MKRARGGTIVCGPPSEASADLVRRDMLADCRDKLSPEQRRCITKADNLEAANSCTETAATVGHKLLDTYVEVLNLYMLLDGTSDREQARQKYLPQ